MPLQRGRLDDFLGLLESTEVRERFDTMKAELPSLTAEQRVELDAYFDFKVRTLVSSLRDSCPDGDEAEFLRLLPHVWIEYRMEWIRYNVQMQYQTMFKGEADQGLMARGASLSYLISVIERFLDGRELFWVTQLAADPISSLSSKADVSRRMLQLTNNAGSAGREIIENFFKIRDEFSTRSAGWDSGAENRFNELVESAEETLSSSMGLTGKDFHDCLEMIIVRELSDSPITIVLVSDQDLASLRIASELASTLTDAFEKWLRALLASSIEGSVAEREAAMKSAHLSLRWNIERNKDGTSKFTVSDDGLGRMSESFFSAPSGFKALVKNEPGQRSELVLHCPNLGAQQMFLGELRVKSGTWRFAIPGPNIVRVEQPRSLTTLPSGAVTARTESGEMVPVIHLNQRLWDSRPAANTLYVLVRSKERGEAYLTLDTVVGTTKSSVRSSSNMILSNLFCGYILNSGRAVPILDVDELLKTAATKGANDDVQRAS